MTWDWFHTGKKAYIPFSLVHPSGQCTKWLKAQMWLCDCVMFLLCSTALGSRVQACLSVTWLDWCLQWLRRRCCCTGSSLGMRSSSSQLEKSQQVHYMTSSVRMLLLSCICHTVNRTLVSMLRLVPKNRSKCFKKQSVSKRTLIVFCIQSLPVSRPFCGPLQWWWILHPWATGGNRYSCGGGRSSSFSLWLGLGCHYKVSKYPESRPGSALPPTSTHETKPTTECVSSARKCTTGGCKSSLLRHFVNCRITVCSLLIHLTSLYTHFKVIVK